MKDITNCPNCGAPLLSNGHCEYCGTVVKRNNNNIVYHNVITTNRPVQKVACRQIIPHEAKMFLTDNEYNDLVKDKMVDCIASCIADMVVFESAFDPIEMREIVTAYIGVADMRGE